MKNKLLDKFMAIPLILLGSGFIFMVSFLIYIEPVVFFASVGFCLFIAWTCSAIDYFEKRNEDKR